MDAKALRAANKDKARRLAGGGDSNPGSQDVSPPTDKLNADVKTGMRPLSRRAFKAGGKVTGEDAKHHAGRPARKSGGGCGESYINRNEKDANEDRDGIKHVGGLKNGGRAKKLYGGGLYGMETKPTGNNLMVPSETKKKNCGGPVKKKAAGGIVLNDEDIRAPRRPGTGGPMQLPADEAKPAPSPAVPATAADKADKPVHMIHSAIKGGGGYVPKDVAMGLNGPGKNFEGMIQPVKNKKAGGRTARQDGGRVAGKGKTNINIIIAPQGGAKPDEQAAPPPPMPKPPMPMPPPAMGAGAPPPMPGPSAGLAAALGAGGGHAPVMRKNGGSVKMTAGAGGGLGRLEKIKEYGDNAKP